MCMYIYMYIYIYAAYFTGGVCAYIHRNIERGEMMLKSLYNYIMLYMLYIYIYNDYVCI